MYDTASDHRLGGVFLFLSAVPVCSTALSIFRNVCTSEQILAYLLGGKIDAVEEDISPVPTIYPRGIFNQINKQ
jgi:hypothetical protein